MLNTQSTIQAGPPMEIITCNKCGSRLGFAKSLVAQGYYSCNTCDMWTQDITSKKVPVINITV